jgi:hypothetical protein
MDVTAGAVLREARQRARLSQNDLALSQNDLARHAGVAQSVISMYESDRREPGLRTLTKLIEATGHTLSLQLIPPSPDQLGLPDSPRGRRIRRHRQATLEHAGAHNPRIFGSVARAEDTATSDIDILVDLDDTVSLVTLAKLTRELSTLLGTQVDVVPAATLKPGIRERVRGEAIALRADTTINAWPTSLPQQKPSPLTSSAADSTTA